MVEADYSANESSSQLMDVDENSEDEVDTSALIKELAEKVESNPYDFGSYVQLIDLHRSAGDLDETRAYRQQV